MRTTALTLLTAAAGVLALAVPASAGHGALTVTGLTANDRLVTFSASDPGTVLSTVRITGLAEGDDVAAIDFRASNGALYAVVTSEQEGTRLFVVDPTTGAAVRVGTTTLPISGSISIDFNPVVDLLRVVSDDGTNLRVDPSTGALRATDGTLRYATGEQPGVGDVAYTDNDTTATTGTTLYDLDAALDQLAVQSPPNEGRLVRVGSLSQPTKAQATGFDVYTRTDNGVNYAFASLFDKGRTTFVELRLADGQLQTTNPVPGSGAVIGTRPHVTDIALAPRQAGF